MSAFERLADAMGAMCDRDAAPINDELAPVLRDDAAECGDQMHRLAHATLHELALSHPDGRSACAVAAYALSTGVLIGYQLGQADALERDTGS